MKLVVMLMIVVVVFLICNIFVVLIKNGYYIEPIPLPPYIFDAVFQEIQQKPFKPLRPRKERNETGSHAYDCCCRFSHLQHFGSHHEYSRSL